MTAVIYKMARVSTDEHMMNLLDGEVAMHLVTNEMVYRKGDEIISLTSDETRIELIQELVSHSLEIIGRKWN